MNVLVFNPGSNSLKAGIVACGEKQRSASDGEKQVEVILEEIGGEAKLSLYNGKKIASSTPVRGGSFEEAARSILDWLEDQAQAQHPEWELNGVSCIGVRVVHGGGQFTEPTEITAEVEREIAALGKWAPLHNHRSVEILAPLRSRFADLPIFAVFDTAFHATIPPKAGLYAIPFDLSRKHKIRRYGFHGISHRYLLERYAKITKRTPAALNLVTMHLESGCSVTAIARGQSVDNTMGITPLEGLMMGTRSGDVDPALIPFLAGEERLEIAEVMTLLEKESGLLGVSGKSLDTRVLMRDYETDNRVQLAMEMFAYRVVKAVGAYLAALGGAHAVIFGGGIAENTPLVRERVCESLRWCGLEMDREQNRALIDIEGRLSTEDSPIQAYVIPVEETLEIAHECNQAMSGREAQNMRQKNLVTL
ncbi:MAG TPA: acetate/propionate family kinase [Terracidiphilus sp.]|jgi:acetate kinase